MTTAPPLVAFAAVAVPPWAATSAGDDRQAEAGAAGGAGPATGRRGGTARTPGRGPRAGCPGPRRRPRGVAQPAARRRQREAHRGAGGRVGPGVGEEVADHLAEAATRRRRRPPASSAVDGEGCSSSRARWSAAASSTSCAQVDRARARAAAAGRGGRGGAGPRRGGPCGWPRSRCGPSPARATPRRPGRPCGRARRSPRMAVSGVRSSWEASAAKRLRRVSLASRSAKAPSSWPSISSRAPPRRPSSVPSSGWSTRRVRSPAAMAPAVSIMSSIGWRPRRTMTHATAAPAAATTTTVRQVDARADGWWWRRRRRGRWRGTACRRSGAARW